MKKLTAIFICMFMLTALPGYSSDGGARADYFRGFGDAAKVARDPLFGGLFENMVVVEALKARLNAGRSPELYLERLPKGKGFTGR